MSPAPRTQARHTARQARETAERRRASQSGVAGFVADRAGQWTLDGPDWGFLELQKYLWNPMVDYWFRMDVEGWENGHVGRSGVTGA